jgi:hypothetical protein
MNSAGVTVRMQDVLKVLCVIEGGDLKDYDLKT